MRRGPPFPAELKARVPAALRVRSGDVTWYRPVRDGGGVCGAMCALAAAR